MTDKWSMMTGAAALLLAACVEAQPPQGKRPPGPTPFKVEAAPDAGFHHPYLLLVPPKVRPNAPVVVALPTPKTSDDPAEFLAAAERMIANAGPFLGALECPVVAPATPRPPLRTAEGTINVYLPALSREALLSQDPKLARIDRQVLAMVDDARRRVQAERGIEIDPRAVFVGFSAAGHFATRMAVLHPGRVLAAWAGGTGMHPILPVAELDGKRLTYPVGIADLKDVSGADFNARAFAKVPIMIAQGSADANTSLPSGGRPSESYSKEQGELVRTLLGQTAAERLEKVKQAYQQAGRRAEFRVYQGVEHRISPEMARDLVQFLRERVLPLTAAREGRPAALPVIDLNEAVDRQVVVDREPGRYLGHPTTLLLEDGKTILCVYPKGHGKGAIVYKRSADGGKTWSGRLPTPKSWETSRETPTLHRVMDAQGKKRVILFSGLHPVRMAVSEDDGNTWSELRPVGDWGGVVTMASVVELKDGPGRYLALFHDDGRFIASPGKKAGAFTLYQSLSTDGGLTWAKPTPIFTADDVHLCEPGAVRSPDGKQLAVLLRENRRVKNSHVIFSDDEGKTWTRPRELPASLNGDRHTAKYAPDGRLFISFRDVPPTGKSSPTAGDWVGWVGTYDDLVAGRDGQYRVCLKKNHHRWDCAYPGVEVLPDGTFVVTTYGHWTPKEPPYILSVRFTLPELDGLLKNRPSPAGP